MRGTERLTGSTGQEYYPTSRTLTKTIGVFPTMEIVLLKDDLPRVQEESYFSFYVGGVLKFKGIIIDPITYDANLETLTVTLRDYIWVLYRDYDLFNTSGSQYRVESIYELVDTTVDNILAATTFTAGTTPPQYMNNRYDWNDRTTALLNLAALVKYGTYTDGTYWTDLAKIETQVGSCDVWLDYAANTVNIGLLGAKNASNKWTFETFDITDYIVEDTLAELQKWLSLPNTVIVLGAGDGLNQIIGKAVYNANGFFFDDVTTDKSPLYAAWGNTTDATWEHDLVNNKIWVDGTYSAPDPWTFYTMNVGIDYVSPHIAMNVLLGDISQPGGFFFAKVDDSNYWTVTWFVDAAIDFYVRLERTVAGTTTTLYECLVTGFGPSALSIYYPFELFIDREQGTITLYLNNVETLTYQTTALVDGEIGLATKTFAWSTWGNTFKNLVFKETTHVPPVITIANNEYVNQLAATHAAETELQAQRVPAGFTLDIDPVLFESGVVDIGQMVSITEPEEAVGTYRVQGLTLTEETCSLTIGRKEDTFQAQSQGTTQQSNVAGTYTTGASVAQALPAFDSPLYSDGANNVTCAYLTFRIPANMQAINLCDLYWYLDYMMVDQQWTAETHSTAFGTSVTVEISINGSTFAAITGSPFTGNQARVSITDVLGYAPQDKIVRLKFSLSAAGEARIYGGGDLQGLVVVK